MLRRRASRKRTKQVFILNCSDYSHNPSSEYDTLDLEVPDSSVNLCDINAAQRQCIRRRPSRKLRRHARREKLADSSSSDGEGDNAHGEEVEESGNLILETLPNLFLSTRRALFQRLTR